MLMCLQKVKEKVLQEQLKDIIYRTQDATHGNSLSHRVPGSIGAKSNTRPCI